MIDTDFEQLNQTAMIQGAKEGRARTPEFKQIGETFDSPMTRINLSQTVVEDDRLAYLEKRDKELAELLGDNLHAISTDRLTYFQKRDKVLTELEAYLKMKSEETETEGHKERQAHNYQNADDLFLQSVVYDDCLEQIELLETAI